MNTSENLLKEFAKRYEYTRMNQDILVFENPANLQFVISKKVCYPGYTHTQFFTEYVGKISNHFIADLQRTLSIVKPSKIKDYQIFYDYNNEIFNSFSEVVTLYFKEMLDCEKTYHSIAVELRDRILLLINSSQNIIRRNIETAFDDYEKFRKIERNEKYKKLFVDILGIGFKLVNT